MRKRPRADGEQAFLTGRAQAGIHLVQPAVAAHGLQRADETLGQAVEIDAGAEAFFAVRYGVSKSGDVVNEDEVDIGAEGHFAAAELAQRDDGKTAAGIAP